MTEGPGDEVGRRSIFTNMMRILMQKNILKTDQLSSNHLVCVFHIIIYMLLLKIVQNKDSKLVNHN